MGKNPNEIIGLLEKFKRKVGKIVCLNKLILFGSMARGDSKKNSDVDIILVSEDFEGQKYFRRSAPFYLAWDYDYDTDIICLTPRELLKKQKEIGVVRSALKEGIEI